MRRNVSDRPSRAQRVEFPVGRGQCLEHVGQRGALGVDRVPHLVIVHRGTPESDPDYLVRFADYFFISLADYRQGGQRRVVLESARVYTPETTDPRGSSPR